MYYEWDEGKRAANIAKHGTDFILAERFDWATAIETVDNRCEYGEERWVALGFIDNRLHVLVYTSRKGVIPPHQPAPGQPTREGIL